jgi:hypothetical protein
MKLLAKYELERFHSGWKRSSEQAMPDGRRLAIGDRMTREWIWTA